MDKLMDNHWFLKGLALLFALMLYTVASLDSESQSSGITGLPVGEVTETLTDVPVTVNYDEEKYVVTGAPKYVTLTLEGQGSVITATKINRQFEVYANLNGYEPGVYEVRLQHEGINDKVKVKITPPKIKVTIAEKVKKQFPVEVSFINSNQMKEGYKADKVVVKPAFVELSGTKEQLDKVAAVKAYIDLKGVNQSINKDVKVVVYDQDGNPLEMPATPATVNVNVPIITPEKKVSIDITKRGTLPEGVTLTNITAEPSQITLYGPKDVLDGIETLNGIFVDLDKITGNTNLEVSVPLPKGVTKASTDKIKIFVQVEKLEKKTFSDIYIRVLGLSESLNVNFIDPKNGKVSVDATANSSDLGKVTSEQIQVSMNTQGLEPGIHDIPIQLNGIDNVKLDIKQKTARVEIVKKG
ncbi:CdaR family protein [Ectobacillus sp. JY-23]|uniref:CdaR family protein n=1 Tax=Ectobacillus sp. JY-23 TaxID=2933872 RepID=UPI001FF25F8B|nr:CdaR family protein [Ectobacillus sp. JY-23]UOY91523.1 CdaR family protein [Ectobacillus sp. JY-23]